MWGFIAKVRVMMEQSTDGKLLRADIKGRKFLLNIPNRILTKGRPRTYTRWEMRHLVRYHGSGDDLAGFYAKAVLGRPKTVQNQGQGQVEKRVQRSLTQDRSRRVFVSPCQPPQRPSLSWVDIGLSHCPPSTCCWDPQPTDPPLLSPMVLSG